MFDHTDYGMEFLLDPYHAANEDSALTPQELSSQKPTSKPKSHTQPIPFG